MNLLGQTGILYGVVGLAVAAAVYLSPGPLGRRRANVLLAIPFWPLYLPLLLARPQGGLAPHADALPADEMTAAIRQVDLELSATLSTLDGSGVETTGEREGLAVLLDAWISQAERIREMDRLLALSSGAPGEGRPPHQEPLERFQQVRRQSYDDLMARLARVRELVSMIHLARFTNAPATQVRDLLARIQEFSTPGNLAAPDRSATCLAPAVRTVPARRPARSPSLPAAAPVDSRAPAPPDSGPSADESFPPPG
jgi:hypothetical protein